MSASGNTLESPRSLNDCLDVISLEAGALGKYLRFLKAAAQALSNSEFDHGEMNLALEGFSVAIEVAADRVRAIDEAVEKTWTAKDGAQ